MSLTISSAAKERKRQLEVSERLERATGTGTAPYTLGETHRNDRLYLTDDSVKDKNGKPYVAIMPSRNKPPANNPDFWKPDAQAEVKRWTDIAVGAQIPAGTVVIHNSQTWVCTETHIKTAGNAPRQGSTIWTKEG